MAFPDYERVDRCTLCGSRDHRPIFIRRHISRCHSCGHTFLTPRPTQAAIAASYDAANGTHALWKAQEAGREVMWRKRAERVSGFKTAGRALDIGTGFGDFLFHLLNQGDWEVEGTEVSREAIEFASNARDLVVHYGQVADCELQPASYDLITMWHVLEHLPQPGATLSLVSELLRPGGVLVIAVPNGGLWPRLTLLAAKDVAKYPVRRALKQQYRSGVQAYFGQPRWGNEIHLSYFHPKRLGKALEQRDLRVVERGVDDLYAQPTPKTDRTYRLLELANTISRMNFGEAALIAAIKRGTD